MTADDPWGVTGEGFPATLATVFEAGNIFANSTGLFAYSGTPGAGNLIFSVTAPGVTADPFGNAIAPPAVIGGGAAIYGASGQAIFLGLLSTIGILEFLTGAAFEATAANMAGEAVGSGNAQVMELLLSGPKGSTVGGRDWVQIELASNRKDGTNTASLSLQYIADSGAVTTLLALNSAGISVQDTTVNGITPGAFSLSSPGATAGAPPTGTATQASSFAAGSPALSYLTAFASTYNTTVAAVNALVNGLSGWGV